MATGRRKSERSTRHKLFSPGRPPVWQRENLCRFWREVAVGLSSEDAAVEALRLPRERARNRGKSFVDKALMISDRPAEIAEKAVPGHWEGDLILGLGSSAIGTLVERTTRFTMLLHLPRMEGHGIDKSVKNGPALAGHGAEAVRDAIAETIMELPAHLRQSLTWDQGAEMAQRVQLRIDTGLDVYFCDPQSPWQRGSNENTNGLLRQYFPKGTGLSQHGADELSAVAHALIRVLTDQNPFAHSLRPMDMMRQGWLSSFRQASQQ